MTLEQFIAASIACTDAQSLSDCFCTYLERYGCNRFLLSEIGYDAADFPKPFTNYPDEWMQRYTAHHYNEQDPVHKMALTCAITFSWEQAAKDSGITSQGKDIMQEAQCFDLRSGVGMSFPARGNRTIGIGIASPDLKLALKPCDLYFIGTAAHQEQRGNRSTS